MGRVDKFMKAIPWIIYNFIAAYIAMEVLHKRLIGFQEVLMREPGDRVISTTSWSEIMLAMTALFLECSREFIIGSHPK